MRTFAQKQKPAQQTKAVKSTTRGQPFLRQNHTVRSILHLQRTIGNQAVQRLLQAAEEVESEEEKLTPQELEEKPDENLVLTGIESPSIPLDIGFQDMGRVGTARFDKQSSSFRADGYPRIFINGGRTGTAAFAGGGGAGPHGNELPGTIQARVVPIYDSRSLGASSKSKAWIRAGTGSLTVKRSYVGMAPGNQGNGYYVTPRAAARADQHEAAHIQNCRGHYNTYLRPLLMRVKKYIPAPAGKGQVLTRFLQVAARYALKRIIGWDSAIKNFDTADTADNEAMGTLDRKYRASPTRLADAGPGKVGGIAYQHRIHVRTEPAPK